ncbi:MAG: hypothetical protein IKQ69_01360 [Oscillospiraceae bacterium]|nr:hypothetical protein [Oscillospiraceae bacterium]
MVDTVLFLRSDLEAKYIDKIDVIELSFKILDLDYETIAETNLVSIKN